MNIFTTILTAAAVALISAPAAALSPSDVVTEYPSGAEVATYLVDANSITQWGADQVRSAGVNSRLATIARTSDGKIYIDNSLSNDWTGYVVGTVSGDKVTITLPQTLSHGSDVKEVSRLLPELAEGSTRVKTYVRDTENTTITYTITDGKLILDADQVFGFTDAEGVWNGYSETEQTFSPFEASLIEVPEGAETFDMALRYQNGGSGIGEQYSYTLLHAAQKGNDLYIKGFSNKNPDGWTRFAIDGDKATFTGAQYLGMNGGIEYLCPAVDSPEFIPGYNVWEHHFTVTESITFAYDAEKRTLTARDENDVLIVNPSPDVYIFGTTYINPMFAAQPVDVSPYPQAPVFDPKYCKWENGEQPMLNFELTPLNVDGQLLNTEFLGFQIYVNDKLYTFDANEYWLDDNMTTIPWNFQSMNIYMLENGYWVVFFEGESRMKNVSIKAVYTIDGKEYLSAPTYPDGKINEDVLVDEIVLDVEDATLEVGAQLKLSATVSPANATNQAVSWSSSNEEVLTVSQSGVVTAVGEGKASVKASATDGSGANARCFITVVPAENPVVLVQSITLDYTELEAEVGTSVQLSATVLPEDADDKTLSWTSGNEAVATVDGSGLVSVIAEGTATITATANDGSGVAATCVVKGYKDDGIGDIFADGSVFDVYTVNGLLVAKDVDRQVFKALEKGLYIVKNGDSYVKIRI